MFISQVKDINIFLKNKKKTENNYKLPSANFGIKPKNKMFADEFMPDNKITFGAGWNAKVEEEIRTCNIAEISQKLAKLGIESDFKDNKVVAWCCEKVANIYNQLNEKYKLDLDLPKCIFVEDFSDVINYESNIASLCYWVPSKCLKNSERIFPEKTLFFNSECKWENLNQLTEGTYKNKDFSSDHFLTLFIHEFGHAAHDGHLLKKYNPETLSDILDTTLTNKYALNYQIKYRNLLSKISRRATINQFETIADDMTKKIASSIDESFNIIKNPFQSSSYPKCDDISSIPGSLTLESIQDLFREEILIKSWNEGKGF